MNATHTTDALPTPARYDFGHRRDVQGMRALAVVLVVLYHADVIFPGGFIGVDVFFVISGFVITGSILRSTTSPDKAFTLYGFYSRRALRLLPSLCALTCVTLAMSLLFSSYSALEHVRATGVAATLFNANHYLMLNPSGYFGYQTEFNALLHTWSLSVEEQFYFVFPLALLIMTRRTSNDTASMMKRGALGMSALGAFSFVSCVWVLGLSGGVINTLEAKLAFFLMPLRAWEFIVGVLLAFALPRLQRVRAPRWTHSMLRSLGVGLVVWCGVTYDDTTLFPGVAAVWPVLGSSLMILAGSLGGQTREPFIAHPLFVRIGDLSYGWYLWHWPLFVFVRSNWPLDTLAPMMGALLVSLGLAWVNERLIEERFRRARDIARAPKVFVLFMLSCMGVPIVFGGGHDVVSMHLQERPEMQEFLSEVNGYHNLGCSMKPIQWEGDSCRWSPSAPSWRGVLLGDSTARQFIPALSRAVPSMGGVLSVSTLNSCAISDLTMLVHGKEEVTCSAWRARAFADIQRQRPDVLIVSSTYDRYVAVDQYTFQSPGGGQEHESPEQKIAALDASLLGFYERFTDLGITVVFVRPVPKFTLHHENDHEIFDSKAFLDFSIFNLSRFANPGILERPAHAGEDPRWSDPEFGPRSYASAITRGAVEIDLTDQVCPNGVCTMRRNGEFVYIDAIHLAPGFVEGLAPRFEEVLRPLLPTAGRPDE